MCSQPTTAIAVVQVAWSVQQCLALKLGVGPVRYGMALSCGVSEERTISRPRARRSSKKQRGILAGDRFRDPQQGFKAASAVKDGRGKGGLRRKPASFVEIPV